MECIFCKIINKELSSKIIYQDEKTLAFEDIKPKAPIHFLIVPRKHIPSIAYLKKEDKGLIGGLLLVARKLAKEYKVSQTGYRLIFNVGKDAGQTVDHLHLHLLGGRKLPWA
jgi:histidine triad (HIT) family protein